jgi:hypothetical protein
MLNTKKMLKHTRKLVFKNKSEKRIKLKGGASGSASGSPLSRVPRPPPRSQTPRVGPILRQIPPVNDPITSSSSKPVGASLNNLSSVPKTGWRNPSLLSSSLSGSVNSPQSRASSTSVDSSRNQSPNVSQDIAFKIETLKDAMTEFARITRDASSEIENINQRIQ